MGASQSSPLANTQVSDVFQKELSVVNEIVGAMLTQDNNFADPSYNFLHEDVCQAYTMVWEKDLDKHLKVDLDNLHGSIYIVPKKDIVDDVENNVRAHKHDLCKDISSHYLKILYIITLIKRVYDLENNGDHSIAGIMERNVKIVDGVMQISYCSIPHKDYVTHGQTANIDFKNLEGLHVFVESFLTPVEKHVFVEQLKAVFARKQRYRIEDMVCNDTLVTLDDYNYIYANKFKKDFDCSNAHRYRRQHTVDLMFEIGPNNPILHSQYCYSKKDLFIPLLNAKNNPHVNAIVEIYKGMRKHYIDNVGLILELLGKLVTKDSTNTYKLKDISSTQLEEIVTELKRIIIMFYVQSIVDFQVLLDYALSNDNKLTNAN